MPWDDGFRFVICTIAMRFRPADAEKAVALLRSGIGCTESKVGCRECVVAWDAVEEDRVRYIETWESDAAFRRHVGSEEFRRVLAAMDMCLEEPQVTVGNLSGRTGLEYLRELRSAPS